MITHPSIPHLARQLAAAALVTTGLVGCSASGPTGPVCTANAVIGLAVHVTDASTSAAIDAATVTATDGAYIETAQTNGSLGGIAALAVERAGTYAIGVRKNGYAPWDTTGVTVTRGACHVQQVTVSAQLTRSGG